MRHPFSPRLIILSPIIFFASYHELSRQSMILHPRSTLSPPPAMSLLARATVSLRCRCSNPIGLSAMAEAMDLVCSLFASHDPPLHIKPLTLYRHDFLHAASPFHRSHNSVRSSSRCTSTSSKLSGLLFLYSPEY
ncbi:hypothetical protein NL676_021597 [Syzygium grande]|nr:hypothetical protein NL676_021597 [Syzygium grande]